ncbi:hypothetical protein D9619_011572 [Psilocybe cf. subviscida]|uniref:Uncharacterized protein n=1 Tax=Psilocybe cf. subviscida TaxID=2480587 RepID=A0A8H5BSW4_9AGAR|nr:hypothetical protein D9619_011572 [Psilocybe cf. subviscida]
MDRENSSAQRIMTCADEDKGFNHETHAKKVIFRSIHNGEFGDYADMSPAKRRKDKDKDLPADPKAQWEKERKAKAEHKKARELVRLEAAADPMSKKKGGKKGRKTMLVVASLDPTITVIPDRVADMVTLTQQSAASSLK